MTKRFLVAGLTLVVAIGAVLAAQTAATRARAQAPPPRPTVRVPVRPTGKVSEPPQPTGSGSTSDNGVHHLTITDDGSIETMLPDGSKRVTKPGVCGATTIAPDGRRSTMSCAQVQPATPPLPDDVSAKWLEGHSEGLLDVARALLGNDQKSIDNYLRNSENASLTIYDRIRVRTDLLSKLTSGF